METEKNPHNAVLIYFIVLIIIVISNMTVEIKLIDIVYLIVLICSVIKYFIVIAETRK